MFRTAFIAAALTLAALPAAAQPDGKGTFDLQCRLCHDDETMGPGLTGVAGRKVAGGSYEYSDALKAKGTEGQTWTDENLDHFLKAPTEFAPGTKMLMSVPDDANRKAVIEYLKTLK